MTGIIYPELVEVQKIDMQARIAVIKVTEIELRPASEPTAKMGGGESITMTVRLDKILTRDERKQKRLMMRLFDHDYTEFLARYQTNDLDVALEQLYKRSIINLKQITPTSMIASKIEYLRPGAEASVYLTNQDRLEADKFNADINDVLPLAAAGLRQEMIHK